MDLGWDVFGNGMYLRWGNWKWEDLGMMQRKVSGIEGWDGFGMGWIWDGKDLGWEGFGDGHHLSWQPRDPWLTMGQLIFPRE